MSRVVGVIPARFGSTRFPGKMLAELCGRPLISWVIQRAKQASSLNQLIVATDDDRIAEAAESAGAAAVLTSPDHPSGTDRIAEAIQDIDADRVVNIQGDEPLVDPSLINRIAETLGDTAWDMVTAAVLVSDVEDVDQPSVVKVVWAEDHRALYFSRSAIPFVRDAKRPDARNYWRHIGLYGYQRPFLERLVSTPPCMLEQAEKLEQLRALHIGCAMKVLETNHVGLGVDEPKDIHKAEVALRQAGLA